MIGTSGKDEVKQAEVKLAAFIVEHHLPFTVMDHLSDLMPADSKIASQFSSKRTKTRKITKNVLAKHFRQQLVETLKSLKFSEIIDEHCC